MMSGLVSCLQNKDWPKEAMTYGAMPEAVLIV